MLEFPCKINIVCDRHMFLLTFVPNTVSKHKLYKVQETELGNWENGRN